MIAGWVGGFILESLVFAAGYFGAEWGYRSLRHAQYLPRFITLHGFQILLLAVAGLMGGALFLRFLKQCKEEARWGALLFAACVSMALAVPLWFYCANNIHPGRQADKNQEWALLAAFGAILINGFPLWVAVQHDELEAGRTDHLRGTQVMKGGQARKEFKKLLKKEIKKGDHPGIVFWGDSALPKSLETQHMLLCGATGTGKTQIMYPLVKQVIERGDKAVIWDVKGTYTQAFMGKLGVGLLAPWDKRSLAWSIGKDIHESEDCKEVAYQIIPEPKSDHNAFFDKQGRAILTQVLRQLDAIHHETKEPWGWGAVWNVVGYGPEPLTQFLQRTDVGRGLIKTVMEAKSGGDVGSTLQSYLEVLEALAKAWPRDGISLREWVRSETSSTRALILGGIPQRERLAGATANLAIQTLVKEILSLGDDRTRERRIWFFLDEFATLGRIDSTLQAFTTGRSMGLCVVAGIQDIGRLEHIYSRELAKTIANTFATKIFLRSDAETARWASEVIGEQEVREHQKSRSQGSHSGQHSSSSDSESIQQVTRKKDAFMASEIAAFPNMEGLFRVPGWPVAHLAWNPMPIPQDAPLVEEAGWLKERPKIDPPSDVPPKSNPPPQDAKEAGDQKPPLDGPEKDEFNI